MSRHQGSHVRMKVEKAKNTKETAKRLIGYLKNHSLKISFSDLFIIFSTFLVVTATRLIGIAIDDYIATFQLRGLLRICVVLIVIYCFSSFFLWMQHILMIRVAQDIVAEIRKELFDKIQVLPLKYFDNKTHGEIMSRITNDVDNISVTLNTSISQILQSILTVITTLAMMLYLSPILTVASLVTIPILMFLTKIVTSKARKYFSERQKKLGNLNGYIEEVISGQKAVKVFSREDEEIQHFEKINGDLLEVGIKSEIFSDRKSVV